MYILIHVYIHIYLFIYTYAYGLIHKPVQKNTCTYKRINIHI